MREHPLAHVDRPLTRKNRERVRLRVEGLEEAIALMRREPVNVPKWLDQSMRRFLGEE